MAPRLCVFDETVCESGTSRPIDELGEAHFRPVSEASPFRNECQVAKNELYRLVFDLKCELSLSDLKRLVHVKLMNVSGLPVVPESYGGNSQLFVSLLTRCELCNDCTFVSHKVFGSSITGDEICL